MSALSRVHQARAMAEARVLDAMAAAPKEVRRAQAARVFNALKELTRAGSDGGEQLQTRHWWLDSGR